MKYLPISEFCITSSGGTPSRSITAYYKNGTIPWIKSGELKKRVVKKCEEYITQEAIQKSSAKLVPKGSILLAMYGATVGEVAELGIEAATNQAICHIIPNKEICDKDYLFHFLKSIKSSLISKSVGGGQPNISQAIVRAIKVPLPPIQEQRRIATILDKAEALRTKRREAITKLDLLLQSVFLEMFGDPINNPKKWKTLKIKELITEKPTNGIFKKNEDYSESGIPVVWVSELFNSNSIDVSSSKRLDPNTVDINKFWLKNGDILFCRSSLKPDGIAYNNVYLGEDKSAVFECHLIKVSLDKEMVDPVFLNFMLRLDFYRKSFMKFAKTSTMTTIDQNGIVSVEVFVPDIRLQKYFSEIVNHFESLKKIGNNQKDQIDKMIKSIYKKFF